MYKRGDKEKFIYIIVKGSVDLKTVNKKNKKLKSWLFMMENNLASQLCYHNYHRKM